MADRESVTNVRFGSLAATHTNIRLMAAIRQKGSLNFLTVCAREREEPGPNGSRQLSRIARQN